MNIIKNKNYYKNNIINLYNKFNLLTNEIYFYKTFYNFLNDSMTNYSFLTNGADAGIFYNKKNNDVIKIYSLSMDIKSTKSILYSFNMIKDLINSKIQLHNIFIKYFNKICDINCQTELYKIIITYDSVHLLIKQQYYENMFSNLFFTKIKYLLNNEGIKLYKNNTKKYITYITNIFKIHNKLYQLNDISYNNMILTKNNKIFFYETDIIEILKT